MASAAKSAPDFASLSTCSRLRLDGRVVFAFGRQQDVTRANLFGRRVLAQLLVVDPLDVFLRHLDVGREVGRIDPHVLDLAAIRNAVPFLVFVVVPGELRVGRIHLRLEVVGEHRDDVERDFFVAAFVFALQLGVRHSHPFGKSRAKLVEHQALAYGLLEIARRHRRRLLLEEGAIALLADELSVLLQPGDGDNLRPHLGVAHGDAGALRLRQFSLLLNHLLQDLLGHLHLLQNVVGQIPAIRRTVGLHLSHVPAPEVGHRNRPGIDGGEAVAAQQGLIGADELRDVEKDKSEDNGGQAPFEPSLMTPHPIKHGHYRSNPSENTVCGR